MAAAMEQWRERLRLEQKARANVRLPGSVGLAVAQGSVPRDVFNASRNFPSRSTSPWQPSMNSKQLSTVPSGSWQYGYASKVRPLSPSKPWVRPQLSSSPQHPRQDTPVPGLHAPARSPGSDNLMSGSPGSGSDERGRTQESCSRPLAYNAPTGLAAFGPPWHRSRQMTLGEPTMHTIGQTQFAVPKHRLPQDLWPESSTRDLKFSARAPLGRHLESSESVPNITAVRTASCPGRP
eukprot:6175099-Pleurochrysis_carterae.AAC.3